MMNRFGDIDCSFKELTPVYGYVSAELVTIEKALQPIESQISNLPYFIKIAKRYCRYPSKHGLTHDESASIYIYTMEWGEQTLYRVLNQTLRNENRHLLKVWFPYMKLFDTALNKLPTVREVVWRGVSEDIGKNFTKNQTITWWTINSCSLSVNVIKGFLGNEKHSTMFLIEAVNGKKVSGYTELESEDEIILKMGTEFRIKSDAMEHPKGSYHVHLIEIDEKAPSVPSEPDAPMFKKNTIFIQGLPSTMPKQLLFDTLWDEFSTVGRIKIDKENKKPCIDLYRRETNEAQLSDYAEITFKKEEAVAEAIKKYDQMHVPTLNNAQIGVKQSEMKSGLLRQANSQVLTKPVSHLPELVPLMSISVSSLTNPVPPPSKPKWGKWKQNAITVAGGNGQGHELNQLNWPQGIFSDKKKHVLIADYGNHRIVEWKYNAIEGQIIAGGNGKGDRMDQLNHPTDVIVDQQNHSIIITDQENRRVIQWLNQKQQILIENIGCYGLAMDKNGFLYVSDRKKNEVRRWKMNEYNNEGVIVAGENGKGDQLNQLNSPTFIFVDKEQSVYISDHHNHRVMKWRRGAKQGRIVAGGNGERSNLNQLSSPAGVIVDDLGQIYVADSSNHRVCG
ncbi:unnamed protein product [Adineta steineri]|uniref:NAD(P)(+)--arginine ADP-ribosyltransferase n=2 Tax=Adineta steineri TaxID=433720 RepID=A0A815LFQ1_9BILA|nr:unnamed protein product [Adineta steineri]